MTMEHEFRTILGQLEMLSAGTTQSWNKSSPPAELDRAPAQVNKRNELIWDIPPHLTYRWLWEAETSDAGRAVVLQDATETLDAWRVRKAPVEAIEFDWVEEVTVRMVGLSPKEVAQRCGGVVTEKQTIRWREAAGKDPSTGQPVIEDVAVDRERVLDLKSRGFTQSQIAQIAGTSRQAVSQMLKRAA